MSDNERAAFEEVPTREESTEVVITKKGRKGFAIIDPPSIPQKTALVIPWAIVSAVENGQLTSQQVYERVRQLKLENPDSAVVGEEELVTELSVTEEKGLLARLLHGDPNISLNFTNSRHPRYVVE